MLNILAITNLEANDMIPSSKKNNFLALAILQATIRFMSNLKSGSHFPKKLFYLL